MAQLRIDSIEKRTGQYGDFFKIQSGNQSFISKITPWNSGWQAGQTYEVDWAVNKKGSQYPVEPRQRQAAPQAPSGGETIGELRAIRLTLEAILAALKPKVQTRVQYPNPEPDDAGSEIGL